VALHSSVTADVFCEAAADRLLSCCLRIACSLDGEEHLVRQCDVIRLAARRRGPLTQCAAEKRFAPAIALDLRSPRVAQKKRGGRYLARVSDILNSYKIKIYGAQNGGCGNCTRVSLLAELGRGCRFRRWTKRLRRGMGEWSEWVVQIGIGRPSRDSGLIPSDYRPLRLEFLGTHARKGITMSELRNRMVRDMQLAGLVEGSRREYLRAARQLAASPSGVPKL
jgi:hypothetical protein